MNDMNSKLSRLTIVLWAATILTPVRVQGQLFTLTRDQMIEYTAQNPFERFPDGRPKVPDALIERARDLSAEEVFAILPGKGYRNQFEGGFQILYPARRMVGRAFTVQFMPLRPDLEGVIAAKAKAAGLDRMNNQAAIDMLQPGDVLVVDLFDKGDGGTIVGDNLFYYIMKATKGAGLVVDGAVRDLDGISTMDMPADRKSTRLNSSHRTISYAVFCLEKENRRARGRGRAVRRGARRGWGGRGRSLAGVPWGADCRGRSPGRWAAAGALATGCERRGWG